jgi:hypothetical protein
MKFSSVDSVTDLRERDGQAQRVRDRKREIQGDRRREIERESKIVRVLVCYI